jgi:hypothetical protein
MAMSARAQVPMPRGVLCRVRHRVAVRRLLGVQGNRLQAVGNLFKAAAILMRVVLLQHRAQPVVSLADVWDGAQRVRIQRLDRYHLPRLQRLFGNSRRACKTASVRGNRHPTKPE